MTLSELYSDTKAPGKRYSAAIAACKSRPECQISMDSAQLFEQSVRASTDELRNHSITTEEPIATFTTFEILPNQAKQALKSSQWWLDILKARDSRQIKIQDQYPAPQVLSWTHLIDTLMASFFPNQSAPNRYERMYWGLSQARSEPFAAYVPRVVDLVTAVSGRALAMWGQEEREIFHDKFSKGLWDFEAAYMDRYFTREWLMTELSMDQLTQMALQLDKAHAPATRSHSGNFHAWRRWIQHTSADYERWWAQQEQEQARGGRYARNRRPARPSAGPSHLHHVADGTPAEPVYHHTMEQPAVNRIVRGQCTICLQPAEYEHQNCVVRCHKCHQEGHRMAECPSKATGVSDNNTQARNQKPKGRPGKSRGDKKPGNHSGNRVVAQAAPTPTQPPTAGGAPTAKIVEHRPQAWRGADYTGTTHHLHSTHGQYNSNSFKLCSLVVENISCPENSKVSCSNVENSNEKVLCLTKPIVSCPNVE
ncbi:MAG: C2HC-type zinc finger protein, partial [Bacteroidota bacterium]